MNIDSEDFKNLVKLATLGGESPDDVIIRNFPDREDVQGGCDLSRSKFKLSGECSIVQRGYRARARISHIELNEVDAADGLRTVCVECGVTLTDPANRYVIEHTSLVDVSVCAEHPDQFSVTARRDELFDWQRWRDNERDNLSDEAVDALGDAIGCDLGSLSRLLSESCVNLIAPVIALAISGAVEAGQAESTESETVPEDAGEQSD